MAKPMLEQTTKAGSTTTRTKGPKFARTASLDDISNMILVPQNYPSPESRFVMERRLRLVRNVYWVTLLALLAMPYIVPGPASVVTSFAFLAVHCWLAATVAESATLLGSSAVAWGGGALFLGPLGMLFLPTIQLRRLRQDSPGVDRPAPPISVPVPADLASAPHDRPLGDMPPPKRTHLQRLTSRIDPTPEEVKHLFNIEAMVVTVVAEQLTTMGILNADAWGNRREFILGYIMGLADGLSTFIGPTEKFEFAGLGASLQLGADAMGDPFDDVVGFVRADRKAYAAGMEAGRLDGTQMEHARPSGRLAAAFGFSANTAMPASQRTIDSSAMPPHEQPSGVAMGEEQVQLWTEAIYKVTCLQLEYASMPPTSDKWGPNLANVVGYMIGMAQSMAMLMHQGEKANLISIRAIERVCAESPFEISFVIQMMNNLQDAKNKAYQQAIAEGFEDGRKLVVDRQNPLALGRMLRLGEWQ